MSRSARENGSGATGAICVVNCGFMKLVEGALLKGVNCCCCAVFVMPKGLCCCCCGWGVWNSDRVCCCCGWGVWNSDGVCCCGWGVWNNDGVCCCCCEKGVEKSEEPNAGVEGVPNAGVAEGVAKAEEDDWPPNIFGWTLDSEIGNFSVPANFFITQRFEGFEIGKREERNEENRLHNK